MAAHISRRSVLAGTDGGISAEVMDDAFRKHFAEVSRARREAGIAAPGETEDGYLSQPTSILHAASRRSQACWPTAAGPTRGSTSSWARTCGAYLRTPGAPEPPRTV